MQVRNSLDAILERRRLEAVLGPVREQFESDLRALTDAEQDSKEVRSAKRKQLFDRILETVELPFPLGPPTVEGDAPTVMDNLTSSYVKKAAEAIYKDLIRKKIAVEKIRPDGRATDEIRPIACEVKVSPRTHGSALFTRGETQIMTLLTLGTAKEGQRIDDLSLEVERRYMHHYNFPPYSVGETGFMRGPKRRDIGHGALAQRALEPMIPALDEFPYTIRLVSETLESNGSSSMGSVCGSTLSLMDAGVPIKRPVSGIAMGLVKEGDEHVILTDIQGAEDHLGDMDFKVAGSREGITALQMDIKITGVTQEIMRNALAQAKEAREFILDKMAEAISESREELAAHAPRITTISIDPEQIGLIIGKGGETIRGLEADYEVQIDIEEDGTILIYATEGEKADAAIAAIQALTKEPEVGDTYTGKVVKTTDFGAFVELKKGTDGLLHVSNVGPGRVGHIEDVISRGDVLDVVVQEVDKARGRIGLKLVGKHENGTVVQPEELIERAKDAPPRERREVGVSPRTHGSALFTRGQTQIMTLLTLGTAKEGQRIDDLSLEVERRYMHHYNFPPYSVGETGFMRGPKRRDIGHGALAQRALEPMIPPPRSSRTRSASSRRRSSQTAPRRWAPSAARPSRSWTPACRSGAPSAASRWASSRRATSTSSSPTSRAPRITSATWTSRSPARARASPPCRWTSRSPASRRRSCATRSTRPSAPASSSSTGWPRRSRSPARSSPRTRRGSRRSRSTRSRSGSSSARAARRSAASRPTTRSRSTSRRTGRFSSTRPRARRPTPPSRLSRRSPRSPRSATRTRARS